MGEAYLRRAYADRSHPLCSSVQSYPGFDLAFLRLSRYRSIGCVGLDMESRTVANDTDFLYGASSDHRFHHFFIHYLFPEITRFVLVSEFLNRHSDDVSASPPYWLRCDARYRQQYECLP